jgi:O-acetylserine/cysteine efflux transporter
MKMTSVCLAIVVALIWGFNFVVIDIGLTSFPPILFSALRFICAAFPAVLFWNKGDIQWRWIFAIGITLGIVMFSLLYLGMSLGMPAGLSSLVLQTQAVFTLLLARLILHDTPTRWHNVGMTTAFLGLGLLVIQAYESASFLGLLLVIAAGGAWAVSNIFMKLCGQINMFRLIIWMSLIPPIPLLLISFCVETGHVKALMAMSWTGIGAILYTGLISTVLAFAIWGKLFREYSPNMVAPFALLVPIFGMLSAFVVLHERLTPVELLSTGLVFAGLVLIVFGAKFSELLRRTAN